MAFPIWAHGDTANFPSFGDQTGTPPPSQQPSKINPFTIDHTANKTLCIAHVHAPLTHSADECLVHPISSTVKGVCSEFKHLSNRAGGALVRELAQEVRTHCEGHGHDRLHTSDVIVTTGGKLSYQHVIHCVAPAHTTNYETAMINSLSSCYVRCMEAAIEQCGASTLAICGLADRLNRGGFEIDESYHVAIRTVKQFLIKYPNKFTRITLMTKTQEECDRVTQHIAPLYFPRTLDEVAASSLVFQTRSPGDKTGAHAALDRRIRVGCQVLAAGDAASPVPNSQRQANLRLAAVETPPASSSKFTLLDFPQLNIWRRNKICIRVRDSITHRSELNGTQFTIYSIRVAETPSLPGYTVWRRYSEFAELRDSVVEEATQRRSSVLGIITTTFFPAKVWFGSMDPDVVKERRAGFDSFLRVLSTQSTDDLMYQLRDFLTPNGADIERAKSEEEDDDDDERDDDDDKGEDVDVPNFVRMDQVPRKKVFKKKMKENQTRTAFGDVGNMQPTTTRPVTRAVARPSDEMKMRRRIREAASGKGVSNGSSGNSNSNSSSLPTKKRASGARMHRAGRDTGDDQYQAEGNRFITNEKL